MKKSGVQQGRIVLLVLAMALFALPQGCGSPEKPNKGSGDPSTPNQPPQTIRIPRWVSELPRDSRYMYWKGLWGRTQYPTDSIKYAKEQAQEELGAMVRTDVVSIIRDTEEDTYVDTAAVTDAVLQGAEFVSHWVDPDGRAGGGAGTAYVLYRIERKLYEELLRRHKNSM